MVTGRGGGGRGGGRGRGRGVAPPSVANTPAYNAAPILKNFNDPPAIFPKTCSLPEPIDPKEENDDFFTIRYYEELLTFMRSSPYYLSPKNLNEHKVDRYSDRYLAHLKFQDHKGRIFAIETDLRFFPEELHSVYNVEKAQRLASARTNSVKKTTVSFGETLAKLKDMEKNEGTNQEGQNGDEDGNEQKTASEDEEAIFEEEELEDETDYSLNYFDNGEDYGDYDDGDGTTTMTI